MARVCFTGHLQRHIACADADVPGATVGEVLDAVFAANPGLRSYLLDDQGRVRKHVNIFVNNDAVADRDRLSDPVAEGDEVFVFQALSGG
ncbi:MAG: MoaD/ThiS family protein [Alphaproteobacteria bacterium]|nr:MoaD/ThiS family protein [Alphaproteobacteria bacterium]